MIDLHSHVLPGVDDGPADLRDSIDLAEAAVAEGTRTLAATPHLREDHPAVRPHELAGRCATLNEHLQAAAVPIEVVSGAEVDVLWAKRAGDEELQLASYGGRGTDLLLETPYGPLPHAFEDVVFELVEGGLRVLLAHPERNPTFQRDAARLAEMVREGVLVQVTASSLHRHDGRSRERALARALVKDGLAHVIASDAHHTEWRRPGLRAGVAAAAELRPGRAEWMVSEAPAAILAGEPLPPPPHDPAPARRGLRQRLGLGR